MSEKLNPTFTDVNRREFICEQVEKDGVLVLAVDRIKEDGTRKRVMLLNKFDAKKLSAACELYLQTIFSAAFAKDSSTLSPEEMLQLFGPAND
ncbi:MULTISPECIES: hypothetical protein [Corynebacterium]|uniref:Uncharacterized protein n=2 Tax=Corynebacterium glucuronolyticum TaxID=39791 RepID=A0A7T4EF04_9CORY|nr:MULTISPECIES: hypothetical protein [Corynebacterium]EEI27565.1 hypothetical protein HMPREF0294_0901 [Corynebacterium glucuronolyticum ATCC 51867]EEI62565.1 hypothetical protein HMPREF0293_1714 [Corynebacterium glucuronolyticum ATCC 51866]MCT1562353.1 hypothetical protein [Corynebacterium glucuronolyticum]OFO43008.1 hypothetical protein HMPREF3044_04260 [Corynebacterium sp. HMSC073D01]QQB46152.1 hypothetical protein I6I10_11995 [Corynebacterium glucuronolyticum]